MLSLIALLAGIVGYGDSIMVGTGAALGIETHARQSMGSCWVRDQMPLRASASVVILSAGINDPPGGCLDSIRERAKPARVIWILPAPINAARAHVAAVAAAHGDRTVSYRCAGGCTRANFHPASYGAVAGDIRKILAEK